MKVLYDRDRGGIYRVFRGGSWNSLARYCRADLHHWGSASGRFNFLGFRPLIKIRDRGLE